MRISREHLCWDKSSELGPAGHASHMICNVYGGIVSPQDVSGQVERRMKKQAASLNYALGLSRVNTSITCCFILEYFHHHPFHFEQGKK